MGNSPGLDREFIKLRSEIDMLSYQFLQIKREFLLRKYDPNQPRIPAGSAGGGQWTGDESIISSSNENDDASVQMATRRSQAFCDAQYARDIFQCKIVKLRSCYVQAMVRLSACERGQQIPPFNY